MGKAALWIRGDAKQIIRPYSGTFHWGIRIGNPGKLWYFNSDTARWRFSCWQNKFAFVKAAKIISLTCKLFWLCSPTLTCQDQFTNLRFSCERAYILYWLSLLFGCSIPSDEVVIFSLLKDQVLGLTGRRNRYALKVTMEGKYVVQWSHVCQRTILTSFLKFAVYTSIYALIFVMRRI